MRGHDGREPLLLLPLRQLALELRQKLPVAVVVRSVVSPLRPAVH